jgi:hypothetical protein
MVAAMNRVVDTDNADMAQRSGANVREFGQVGCASDHSAETGTQPERHRARTTTISPGPNRLDERGFGFHVCRGYGPSLGRTAHTI